MGQNEIEKFATEWVFEKNGYKWFRKDDSADDNKRSFIARKAKQFLQQNWRSQLSKKQKTYWSES
jgi:hypothetical protein